MLKEYRQHVEERAKQGIPPLPLDAAQCTALVELLQNPPKGEEDFLLELLSERVPPGVDEAAYVKAGFLSAIARRESKCALLGPREATDMLGTMLGGYNVATLVELLKDEELAANACAALKHTLLVFDAFNDITEMASAGNPHARELLESWADGEWFLARPKLAESIPLRVFLVPGETNTDDLSPAQEAWSRPDIPLHANSMYQNPRPGLENALAEMARLKEGGVPLIWVGDVLGTGSSRKSATNSVLWHIGNDIPHVPNKRTGGFCLGGKIAPIFFNTMEDAGAFPMEADPGKLENGAFVDLMPYSGELRERDSDKVLTRFELSTPTLLDEVRAGGRINLIIGRGLTEKARAHLKKSTPSVFAGSASAQKSKAGFTLAQKMVGRACGVEGIRPHEYCEPRMTTVGSQDTTGPMTRNELKDLACMGFSSDLVMQSFCHTSAYPKPVDIDTQHTLPDFIVNRGGVSLRPGDGIIHSWLNRMLLPDTVGTGGDSHTRFPIGISFPAGSGLVAFAAAVGVMPLDMPESVRVRFKGKMQTGITLRDLVNAIPYAAAQEGLLTLDKKGKKNIFSGRILEIEGLPDLKIEQAFEFSDASAERSCSGCTVLLDEAPIREYLQSNVVLLRWMIDQGYRDARTLERRAQSMEAWLAKPELMQPDKNAEYLETIEIDLDKIKEPLLACPNDPDDIKPLSEVSGDPIDEVFIGSCMTNIGHYRAASKVLDNVAGGLGAKLWIAPPTRMDERQLMEEGHYSIFGRIGARTEMPGCSLCMGNQARVAEGASVVSTSTRNFPNRLGKNANVYLSSAELAAVSAALGRIPDMKEYLSYAAQLDPMDARIYRYLNFNEIESFCHSAERAKKIPLDQVQEAITTG